MHIVCLDMVYRRSQDGRCPFVEKGGMVSNLTVNERVKTLNTDFILNYSRLRAFPRTAKKLVGSQDKSFLPTDCVRYYVLGTAKSLRYLSSMSIIDKTSFNIVCENTGS